MDRANNEKLAQVATSVEAVKQLWYMNTEMEALHASASGFNSLDDHRKAASALYAAAIRQRDLINNQYPQAWGYTVTVFDRDPAGEAIKMDEVVPYAIPPQPKRWFMAALTAVTKRNARRDFIKARYAETKTKALYNEAWELGPYEPSTRGDNTATEYLKAIACSMREDAEATAHQDGACIGCGNLAAPDEMFCTDCGIPEDDRTIDDPNAAEHVPTDYAEAQRGTGAFDARK